MIVNMSSLLLVGAIGFLLMVAVLTWFSDDIINGQKEIRNNFVSKRKLNLRKINLGGEVTKELIKITKKGFFVKRRDHIELLIHKDDMKITYAEYIIICIISSVVGWFIGSILNNWLISVFLAIVAFTLPKGYLKFVAASLKRQINEQLETVLSQIIGLLPSKKTLSSAIEACIETMEEPLKIYFTEFINNINNANRSFDDALNDLARKIDSKAFYDFARLAMVHYKQGGETMYAFSSIPETMRDIKMIQSEQESELDSLKMMGYMFVLTGPLCFVYYYFTDKVSFDMLINTSIGKVLTTVALIITIITIKIIRSLSTPVEM